MLHHITFILTCKHLLYIIYQADHILFIGIPTKQFDTVSRKYISILFNIITYLTYIVGWSDILNNYGNLVMIRETDVTWR